MRAIAETVTVPIVAELREIREDLGVRELEELRRPAYRGAGNDLLDALDEFHAEDAPIRLEACFVEARTEGGVPFLTMRIRPLGRGTSRGIGAIERIRHALVSYIRSED